MTYMQPIRRFAMFMLAAALLGLLAGSPAGASIIDDHFDDGDVATNTTGDGTGFVDRKGFGASPAVESGSILTQANAADGTQQTLLLSNETFSVASAMTTRITWTLTDVSKNLVNTGNGRMLLGVIADNESGTSIGNLNPYESDRDGLWIAINHDQDPAAGEGVGGLAYIDGADDDAVGFTSFSWDDNGAGVGGGTLIDFGSGATREDRNSIDMIAGDVTVILDVSQDAWSLSFASTDTNAVLPASVSGTFTGLGAINDLSNVHAAAFLQGNGNTTFSFDRITVESIAVPAPVALPAGLVLFGGMLMRRR
ncbi:hypothetical protein HED60_03160 [Planctomycetales bacterium ZRK34]|nr:hypothetical protein HED60_03160 [Planctomycetales bacterium ZRK34]